MIAVVVVVVVVVVIVVVVVVVVVVLVTFVGVDLPLNGGWRGRGKVAQVWQLGRFSWDDTRFGQLPQFGLE